ncbi:hypothetical protein [Bradyrhizobium sp. sBnM-33]|uniref:hypothetical protein n=1 Tax=Bradyrhizobium sp. sBnM-33 TaxID=2831780 RepID=UPI001BCDA7DD|nr:hypothetical protein [Bradyrhizobium sp. sBnM-33]WOH53601.1 hypothetical protein RX328_16855 [Bradyrhizobium sp. sBnM-33]
MPAERFGPPFVFRNEEHPAASTAAIARLNKAIVPSGASEDGTEDLARGAATRFLAPLMLMRQASSKHQ